MGQRGRQTDGHQTDTLRLPIDTVSGITHIRSVATEQSLKSQSASQTQR